MGGLVGGSAMKGEQSHRKSRPATLQDTLARSHSSCIMFSLRGTSILPGDIEPVLAV
jgi:hypothetical protein